MIQYMISDGNGSYIRKDEQSNKYVQIKNKFFATKWEQRVKAKNVLDNAIPKNIRHRYQVIAEDDTFTDPVISKVDCNKKVQIESPAASVSVHIDTIKTISNQEIVSGDTSGWINKIEEVGTFFTSASERVSELSQKLSELEREIQDIHHFVELNRFNAYQGWLVSTMLRNRLKQRREIKDELSILVKIKGCSMTQEEMDGVRTAANALSNREYKPRVLTELFYKTTQ